MIKLVRTNSENSDFVDLVKQLDAYLKITDQDEHEFYNQFNNIDVLNEVVVAYLNEKPLGCGAFKAFEISKVEIKRMYTSEVARNKGVASKILNELEHWASELGYKSCVLETGIRQKEAVQFYKKNGYLIIPKYGPYKTMENSLCFEKTITNENAI